MSPAFETLLDLLRSLFGAYEPISYIDASGASVIPSGASGVNFEYIAQIALFGLVVWCLFRLLGLFFSRH